MRGTDALEELRDYAFEPNSNLIAVSDNLGRTTLTSHDELNRPTPVAGPAYIDPS